MTVTDQLLDLQRRLSAVDSRVLLVRHAVLVRLARQGYPESAFSWQVPHSFAMVCNRAELLAEVAPDEIGIASAAKLPATILLLPRPSDVQLASEASADLLHEYARRLFHLRLEESLQAGWPMGAAGLRRAQERRWDLGFPFFAEAERVLCQERRLPPGASIEKLYQEWAATFLELFYFQPGALPTWFPGLFTAGGDIGNIVRLIRHDVDDQALGVILALRRGAEPESIDAMESAEEISCHRTQDFGLAKLPTPTVTPAKDETAGQGGVALAAEARCPRNKNSWQRRAEAARQRGNLVRAILLVQRCLPGAVSSSEADQLLTQLNADLDQLAEQLTQRLALPSERRAEWAEALSAVVVPAARFRGDWPREARLLYDLQKAAHELSRELEVIEIVPWIRFLGRVPLRRKLPQAAPVLALQHLRRAAKKLQFARLAPSASERLLNLIEEAQHHLEDLVSRRLGPEVQGVLDEVGLCPQNVPERAARGKLIAELLRILCRRGYLQFGDLRDSWSRNELKMADLAGPSQLWRGDALLRADRLLMTRLDGLYQAGAVYHRWFHRGSALFFGTAIGRWLTLFALLPLLAAFVILEGLQHSVGIALEAMRMPVQFATSWSVALLAVYLLGLLHSEQVRRQTRRSWRALFWMGRRCLIDFPRWVIRWPPLRRLLETWLWQWLRRVALRPALVGLLGAGMGWAAGGLSLAMTVGLGLAIGQIVLDQTPRGRRYRAWLAELAAWLWQRVSLDLFPALVRWVLDLFKAVVERLERALYSIDERLRFQTDDRWWTIWWKAIFGVVWYFLTYVFRFALNLLVEPQINPIKHFPVVTVSHKLLLPTIPHLAGLASQLWPQHAAMANTLATGFVFAIPGVFGYLVWELKENWRLYRRNRPRFLQPTMIGSHGETLRRLLRPGFHSGTIPKAWAGLRRADKLTARGQTYAKTHVNALQQLHHCKEDLAHFFNYELLAGLNLSSLWETPPLRLDHVELTPNRIIASFSCPFGQRANLTLIEHAGRILMRCEDAEWRSLLSQKQREIWELALSGLLRRAGVDVLLDDPTTVLWPAPEGLAIWRRSNHQPERILPWPDDLDPAPAEPWPTHWHLAAHPLAWDDWVREWEEKTGHVQPPCDV